MQNSERNHSKRNHSERNIKDLMKRKKEMEDGEEGERKKRYLRETERYQKERRV